MIDPQPRARVVPPPPVPLPPSSTTEFQPVAPLQPGGLAAHAAWRAARVCSVCGAPITRGPMEQCRVGHVVDVPAHDVPPPPPPAQPPEVERVLALGAVLRWLLGAGAAVLIVFALLCLPALVIFGLVHLAVAVPLVLVLLVALVALVVSPAALALPFALAH